MSNYTKMSKEESDARMAYYSIKERLAFDKLSAHANYTVTKYSPIDKYESWDAIYVILENKQHIVSEIKVRKHFSTSYKDWIFEYKKYEEINKLTNFLNNQPLPTPDEIETNGFRMASTPPIFESRFIVFFFDKVVIWDLKDIKEEDFYFEELKATSVNNNQAKVDKKITKLNIANAQIIDYQLDYDAIKPEVRAEFMKIYPNNQFDLKTFENGNY